jgi:hypothetical protein
MRVSRRNKSLLCVYSASPALGLWGLASAQAQANASAGPPRMPGQDENCIQIYLRAGLKTHGPGLHDYPQFIADWKQVPDRARRRGDRLASRAVGAGTEWSRGVGDL